jgi:hypothetical protein
VRRTYAEYEAVRRAVRERVALDWRTPGLRLDGISHEALRTARGWKRPPRLVDWDWQRIVKRKAGADLDLAIWHEDVLCGLAYGQAKAEWLEIGWLEGNSYGHPLQGQIIDLVLAVLGTQAVALGFPETRLKNPIEPLRDKYRRRGWPHLVIVGDAVYLCSRKP